MRTERIAASIASAWVRFYTRGLPREWRDRRRAEVTADIFDQCEDAASMDGAPVATGAHILWRTAAGVLDDVAWRAEVARLDHTRDTGGVMTTAQQRAAAYCSAAAGLIIALHTALPEGFDPYVRIPMFACMALALAGLSVKYRRSVDAVGLWGGVIAVGACALVVVGSFVPMKGWPGVIVGNGMALAVLVSHR